MRDVIDRTVAQGGLDSLVGALEGAGVREVRYAAGRLARAAGDAGAVLRQVRDLVSRDEPASLLLACQLIPTCYRDDPAGALDLLQRLADGPDWTVRDAAAEVCGRLLRHDFNDVIAALRAWREHGSVNVRRAVVIAAARAARPDRLEQAEPLLKLLEPLLSEEDATLRRSLGPSALGGCLLRCYPVLTFEYLVRWSTSNESAVLWNVAMALAAPAAAPIARKALIVLRKLSLDERRPVWRAVASAMWKLGRRCPEIFRPELLRWLEDEQRQRVAREALKYI